MNVKIPPLLTAALIVLCGLWGLGDWGLLDPDEGRYSEIPREMMATGDYVTPRLNYVKYFEKPVLHYWFTAACFAAFGQNEFASRLTPALCGLGGVFVAFVLARRIYGLREAVRASVILSTCLLWFAIARLNILDMTVSFFITVSLAGFWLGLTERRYLLLFYAGMALATLTKGLIGVVLPVGIVFWYVVLTRRWRLFLHALYPPGAALFLVLSVPWFWAVCSANPDFFYFFFVQEHFLRYATQMHGRYQPFWFFVPILAGGLIPWAGLLPDMLRGTLPRHDDAERSGLFLGLWFAVPFLFFSLSSSKLIPYIVPCLPPLAILGGRALTSIADGDVGAAKRFGRLNGALLLLLAAAGVIYPPLQEKIPASALYPYTLPASISLAALALCGWKPRLRHMNIPLTTRDPRANPSPQKMVMALCLLAFVNALVFARGFTLEAGLISYKEPAAAIQERLQPGDVVAGYGDIMQGLGFYLKRRIVLVNAVGELEFGARQEKDPRRWFIGREELKALWDGKERVFLASDGRKMEELERLLGKSTIIWRDQTRNDVVLSNRGLE
ncbi:MAG: glycosyltransferase family 39 protein [Synergistaceae bacterium]|jgi:4-amino-4-deoxy-L-arabinose transferase-like glycosyltransferase|nr:glycosyltransferase family 39 protein [Synergistaceae bacterium]